MLVFHKQRLVMLAVPKTGTTALEQALSPFASAVISDPPWQKHVQASQYRMQLATFFNQRGTRPMELVAVMREPVEWLNSWYRYRSRPQLRGTANSTAGLSFDEFVAAWLEPKPPAFANITPQADYLTDDEGIIAVDHLFRYNDLGALLTFFERKLNTKLVLPQVNVSPKLPAELSDSLRERLKSHASADFDLWHQI